MIKPACHLLPVLFLAFVATPSQAKTFHVIYLGGQSNMDGYGYVRDLEGEMAEPTEGVWIFHGNTAPDGAAVDGKGTWSQLRPGHGVGFTSDGESNAYSKRFGVELTFAQRLKQLRPDINIALIKYSRGGTSIDQNAAGVFGCWEPDFDKGNGDGRGINQYDHFLATIRHAMSDRDIDDDGEEDQLVPAGIVWMQGESDGAYTAEIADRYQANLKRLMDLVRATLRSDDLPVVIGRISDSGKDSEKVWKHGDTVREAQAAFVENDTSAALVESTDEYGYSDPWHYDSAGYIDLGRKFAEALESLEE